MNIAALVTPFAVRLMLVGILALAGVLGVGWWSHTATVNRLTRERDTALEAKGALLAQVERQSGRIAELGVETIRRRGVSEAAVEVAEKAITVLERENKELRGRVLPADPIAACTAADALILEYAR